MVKKHLKRNKQETKKMQSLTPEERSQLRKLIKGTGYVPPGLYEKPEVVKEITEKKSGPVKIVLKESDEEIYQFDLISVRKNDGFYGEAIEFNVGYIKKLEEIAQFIPWIFTIRDDREDVFPYYQGNTNQVIFSPILVLARNLDHESNKIDPYNAPSSAFLFLFNPKTKKLFLEAVSKTVVSTVAITEAVMLRNKEQYDRGNHAKNWLYYFLFDGKKKTNLQIFSMRAEFSPKYQNYVASI